MTMWGSPVDDIGNGMWSGGGTRPWWDYPTPLGPVHMPKVTVGVCYQETSIPNEAFFLAPVFCPGYPYGYVFTDGASPWASWLSPVNKGFP